MVCALIIWANHLLLFKLQIDIYKIVGFELSAVGFNLIYFVLTISKYYGLFYMHVIDIKPIRLI